MGTVSRLHTFKYRDFTDKKNLGEGEFGVVYAVQHPEFHKLAVRIISRRFFPRQEERNALLKEAEQLFAIVSENVVRFLGVVMEPEHLCLVFEYEEYGSLDKVLTRHLMPWPLKIRISYEIALGMRFLHEKDILHLRLKCRNVLIAGNIRVKISDLCFTRNREMNTWTRYAIDYTRYTGQHSRQSRTIDHVPPELIRDVNASPDKATDVYAYGIILWQILTNQTPYKGLKPSDICTQVESGARPDLKLVTDDRPEVIFNLMCKCWDGTKESRPNFGSVVTELKPKFEEIETEARSLALKCQEDIDHFCFPQGPSLQHPHYDVTPVARHTMSPEAAAGTIAETTNEASQGDGRATEMSTEDERVEPKLHAVPIGYTPPTHDPPGDAVTVIPGENSARQATVQDLYKIAEQLAKDWRKFGRSLGFSDGQLDNIDMNYQKDGYPEIPYQMLRHWKQKEGIVTVGYIVKKLKSDNLSNIAAYLDP